jgi:putative aldouronate transport system substrate-binding protein
MKAIKGFKVWSVIGSMLFISACGGSAGGSNGGSSAQPGVGNPSAPAAPKSPVKLNVFVSGSTGLPTPDKDVILQQLNKDLNMEMEFNAPVTDFQQQLSVKIAGGTPPDLFHLDKVSMEKYAPQGVLLEIGKYLDKMPNIKAKWPEEELNKGKVNGKIYALPKRPLIPINNSNWIRKDWLDKLGLAVPQTPEDLLAVASAFTFKDPDGNGKQDTYGMTGSGLGTGSPFVPIWSAYNSPGRGQILLKNNKPVYSTIEPEFKAALAMAKKFIEAKVVDPEFMANQSAKADEKAYKGQMGITYAHWAKLTKDTNIQVYKAVNPAAEWLQMDAISGPGGKFQGYVDLGAAPGFVALSSSLEKHPDTLNKALEYVNYVSGGKGETLVNYGLEGQHYKVNNGKIEILPASNDVVYSFIHQITNRDDYEYLQVKFPTQKRYYDFTMKQPYIKVYTGFVSFPQAINAADLKRFEEAEIVKFMYGQRSLDEFDQFVKTIKETYKIDSYLTEAETKLKSIGIIK